jgi:uncharacterized membrane protein HdeD (DUF308 family)
LRTRPASLGQVRIVSAWWYLWVTIGVGVLLTGYNAFYLRTQGRYGPWVALRPALLYGAGAALFMVVPGGVTRTLFLFASFLLFAGVEYFVGSFAENVVLNETLVVAFGAFQAIFGFAQLFPKFETLYLAMTFGASFAITRALFEFTPYSERDKITVSALVSLVCAELFWALSFLPFHSSALALALFCCYHCAAQLSLHHLYGTLTSRKVQFHFALAAVATAAVLLLTPWQPIG